MSFIRFQSFNLFANHSERLSVQSSRHHQPRKVSGFTMVELLLAVTVVIILASIGVPQFTSAIQTQRTSGEINNLLNDVRFARSEAQKEGQMVGLCVSSNGASCTGSTWQSGWIVYSAGATAGFVAGTSVVLRVQPAFTSSDTITTTPGTITSLTFNREGFTSGLSGTAGLLFTLRNSTSDTSATRCLWVDVLGRSYVQKSGAAAFTTNGQTTSCT